MPFIRSVHHIAIICSDFVVSKHFYVDILGLEIIKEEYREDRDSFKLDLALNGIYIVELFSFSDPPKRLSRPEGTGLRHLAFGVENVSFVITEMNRHNIEVEPIRIDEGTGKEFTFIRDPDNLPIEFYQL